MSLPASTDQRIGAPAAVENVGAGVAGHDVGEVVAGQVDGRRCGGIGGPQRFHRHVHTESVAHRRVRIVGALAGSFDDRVRRVVDEKRIVAFQPSQSVGTASAVDQVGPRAAIERIVAGSAVERVVAKTAVEPIVAAEPVEPVGAEVAADFVVDEIVAVERIAGIVCRSPRRRADRRSAR